MYYKSSLLATTYRLALDVVDMLLQGGAERAAIRTSQIKRMDKRFNLEVGSTNSN